MPRGKDWMELVRSTFRSVGREEMSGLYAREWRHAREKLTAEDREEIEREPKRIKRFLKSANAVLFGLSKRLAPARRVAFGAALLLMFFSFNMNWSNTGRTHRGERRVTEYKVSLDSGFLIASITLLTLLLGMELVDKINYRDELELARELQSSLIPKTLPAPPGFEVGAFNRIANMVGGDIYDFVLLPDGRLAVLFGDASGHGMTAGLVMAVAHAAFRTQLETDPAPEAMFATLNRILFRTGGPRAFFGCVYLLVSPDGSFEAGARPADGDHRASRPPLVSPGRFALPGLPEGKPAQARRVSRPAVGRGDGGPARPATRAPASRRESHRRRHRDRLRDESDSLRQSLARGLPARHGRLGDGPRSR